jgi:hypothetical protein
VIKLSDVSRDLVERTRRTCSADTAKHIQPVDKTPLVGAHFSSVPSMLRTSNCNECSETHDHLSGIECHRLRVIGSVVGGVECNDVVDAGSETTLIHNDI